MAVPKEYGGLGYDSVTQGIVLEQWGYGCAGFGTTLAASVLSMDSVLIAGTEAQKKTVLRPPWCKGEIGAFALTEPGAGSDAGGRYGAAKKDGDEYVLNGTKCFISKWWLREECTSCSLYRSDQGRARVLPRSSSRRERARSGCRERPNTSWASAARTRLS